MGTSESKENIPWVRDLEKAVLISGFTGKPIFLMILKSLCPTCQEMEPKYNNSKDFRRTKCVDQAEVEEMYAPDGQYVPRILFLDTKGKQMNQFFNIKSQRSENRYFYPQADDIVQTMLNVLYYFYPYNNKKGN
ncbi:UNVERIFIED_CONTAM: hypothetical protein PYX00_005358 [Menopon gallinae]|uniref:Thioredoxin domain-containing protein 12 n=1 Tax=Menopon gallinae TaxID=328185 RepID=A0AAW2HR07_9NEOP